MTQIILGSKSIAHGKIMEEMGYKFTIMAADIDGKKRYLKKNQKMWSWRQGQLFFISTYQSLAFCCLFLIRGFVINALNEQAKVDIFLFQKCSLILEYKGLLEVQFNCHLKLDLYSISISY